MRKGKEDETTEKWDWNPLKGKLRLMCSTQTEASPWEKKEEKTKNAKSRRHEKRYQIRHSCKRTESYWGKKNGTRERTRVPEAAGSSSGEFNWGISWDLELVFKMY